MGRKINIYEQIKPKIKKDDIKKVSVIIPNYNYENYIIERIDSILNQTYPVYEIVILDDCSTDNSAKVIEKKIKETKDINIRFIKNSKNSGVFAQWQKGFKETKGDYVWIAEADDICNCEFLEHVMKGFDNDDVVLSYSESMRIDENNEVTSDSCRDYMLAVSTDRWNQDYICDGKEEIIECLSVCNTIPNVSSVVWKRKNQIEILENAKRFKMSGDWYIYFKFLSQGKISYCAESLNYFRKHSKSASTVASKRIELEELLTIQKEIREEYVMDSYHIHRQSFRYGNMLKEMDEKDWKDLTPLMAKKVAWITPYPIKGSGGIRTMIMHANYLVKKGYECDIYVEEDYESTSEILANREKEYYGEFLCNIYVGVELRQEYDLIFATYSVLTADYANYLDVKRKAYFIQDFEPWFVPMGQDYLEMERSYKYGLEGISIGKWLAHKLSTEYGTKMNYFDFCADLNVYKKLDNVEKENAVCFIFQPEKPRRGSMLGLRALKLVKKLRPDVKIYLYGADVDANLDFEVENLKILPVDKCNELYNKCSVGLCISTSNPSRIPFEMMAAGLPTVDLYRENNLYDIPDTGVLLADSTPEAIATAIIKIIDDKKLQEKMSKGGISYMKNSPIEKGYEQFLEFVKKLLDDKLDHDVNVEKIYNKEPVLPSKEVMEYSYLIKKEPVKVRNSSKKVRRLVHYKRLWRYNFSKFIVKLFRI